MSVCVCVPVREHISRTTRAIFNILLHVAYGRGSAVLRRGDIPIRRRGNFWVFSSPLTMHCMGRIAVSLRRTVLG